MKRRSFLASLFAAIVAPVLARAATAVEPITERPERKETDIEYIEDSHPMRFNRVDGRYVQAPRYAYTDGIECIDEGQVDGWNARPNPDYFTAQYEQATFKDENGFFMCTILQREK